MKTLTDHLGQYAEYHRDRRNIATHFVGVPMIVFAVLVFLSRPALALGPVTVSPVWPVLALVTYFYARFDKRFAAVMALLYGLGAWWASGLAAASTTVWLGAGLSLFVIGWAIQFLGHFFEGKKPAFVDDISGFLIGPLFVTAEAGYVLGLRLEVRDVVERRAGPTRVGRPVAQT